MKTLDISAYGVEEMNQQEMMQVEGGFPLFFWAAIGFIVLLGVAYVLLVAD
jgi:bacteriocin-like protein